MLHQSRYPVLKAEYTHEQLLLLLLHYPHSCYEVHDRLVRTTWLVNPL